MGQYSERINTLLSDPELYRYSESQYQYYRALRLLSVVLKSYRKDDIAMWGGSATAVWLRKGMTDEDWKKIAFIVDNEIRNDKFNLDKSYTVPEELNKKSIKAVLIAGFERRQQIKEELRERFPRLLSIDIYELMKNEGFSISRPFYMNATYGYHDINEDLRTMNENGYGEFNQNLKRLIGDYFHIRDFVNAFRYIDLLIMIKDEESLKYDQLKVEIQHCFYKIKSKLNERRHIIINWIDALRPEESVHMPFLNGLKQQGTYFVNSYTVAPYTTATLKTIFTGELYLDGKLWEISDFDELRESELFNILLENGYKFRYFGALGFNNLVSNRNTIPYVFEKKPYEISSCIWQYEMISNLEDMIEPCFVIVHNIAETHTPYHNGWQTNFVSLDDWGIDVYKIFDSVGPKRNEFIEQIRVSQKYLDEQLNFYGEIYKNVKNNIYMSDHGQYRGEKTLCLTGETHVLFLLLGANVPTKKLEKLFSLRDFPLLIKELLSENVIHFDDCLHDYVFTQTDDAYNNDVVKRIASEDLDIYKGLFLQHRGVITSEDAYVCFPYGDEYYLRLNKQDNLIYEERYRDRIEKLKKITGNTFIDVYRENKYRYSRYIYEEADLCIDENVNFF